MDSVRACRAPLPEGHVTSPDPFPSERRVRLVGVGRMVREQCRACLVPYHWSHSVAIATGMAEWWPESADGTPITSIVGVAV